MPMAISLVGASIIWRFVYAARDTNSDQTGILNAIWIWIGRLSHRLRPADSDRRGVIFVLLVVGDGVPGQGPGRPAVVGRGRSGNR